MQSVLAKLIFQLLQYKRAAPQATHRFAVLKHNDDLCPRFQRKLDVALDAFKKYRKIIYDVQGFTDQGTDIVLREVVEEEDRYICFQIKSEGDMQNKQLDKTLKAQWVDTCNFYGKSLLDYYILLCCNSDDKKNKAKIRSAEAAFTKIDGVHVIEPEYALSFLGLSTTTIDAALRSKLGSDDVVFLKALEIAGTLTPTEKALVFVLLWYSIYEGNVSVGLDDFTKSDFLVKVYNRTPPMPREWFFEDDNDFGDQRQSEFRSIEYEVGSRIASDLDILCDNLVSQDYSGRYSVDADAVRPLAAIMLDGNIRYEYTGEELLIYMMDVFGRQRGYETPQDPV